MLPFLLSFVIFTLLVRPAGPFQATLWPLHRPALERHLALLLRLLVVLPWSCLMMVAFRVNALRIRYLALPMVLFCWTPYQLICPPRSIRGLRAALLVFPVRSLKNP